MWVFSGMMILSLLYSSSVMRENRRGQVSGQVGFGVPRYIRLDFGGV